MIFFNFFFWYHLCSNSCTEPFFPTVNPRSTQDHPRKNGDPWFGLPNIFSSESRLWLRFFVNSACFSGGKVYDFPLESIKKVLLSDCKLVLSRVECQLISAATLKSKEKWDAPRPPTGRRETNLFFLSFTESIWFWPQEIVNLRSGLLIVLRWNWEGSP